MKASIIVHDTWIVLRADVDAFLLFRARPEQLIGVRLVDLIANADLRGLASLRMRIARERDPQNMPAVDYLFKRFDNTRFFGRVRTHKLDTDGEWESTILFLYEYQGLFNEE